MEINFKGQFLNKTLVEKYNYISKTFVPTEVSFVELKNSSKKDLKTLKKISWRWGYKTFASRIYREAKNDPKVRTFALTTQNSNYEKLDSKKILGLGQTTLERPGVYNLDYLQAHPNYIADNKNREYKNIGTGLINGLKKLFNDNIITVTSLPAAIDFYLKNGFNFCNFFLFDLYWKNKNK